MVRACMHVLKYLNDFSCSNSHILFPFEILVGILIEAKFHVIVDRQPLRENSAAWQRLGSSTDLASVPIPSEFQAWVGSPSMTLKDHQTNRTQLEPVTSASS